MQSGPVNPITGSPKGTGCPVIRKHIAERFIDWALSGKTKLYLRGQQGKSWVQQRALDKELFDQLVPFFEDYRKEVKREVLEKIGEALIPLSQRLGEKVELGRETKYDNDGSLLYEAEAEQDIYEEVLQTLIDML